jgi:uncharacterized SAM-binding protein YcdF (DUF218 family)
MVVDVLKGLVLPSNLVALLLVVGLLTRFFPRVRRASNAAFITAAVLLLTFSSGWVAAALLGPLEHAHRPLDTAGSHPEARYIVVLTGYASYDKSLPLTSRPNGASLFRLVEALRIYRTCSDCTVIVSGTPVATQVMRDILIGMGLPADRFVADPGRLDTAASAASVGALVKGEAFFLVTSAGHMPRSIAAFRKAGLKPVAAPADFQIAREVRKVGVLPSPLHLHSSDFAVHEYVGWVWYRVRGWI